MKSISRVAAASALAVCVVGVCDSASADYRSAVEALNPTHYWRLDETGGAGTIAVDSAGNVPGTYGGNIDAGLGELGVEGPPVNIAPGNLAFNANDYASVDIGPGAAMAAPTMTIAACSAPMAARAATASGPIIKPIPTPAFRSSSAAVPAPSPRTSASV